MELPQNITLQDNGAVIVTAEKKHSKAKQKSPIEKETDKFNKLLKDIELLEQKLKEQEETTELQKALYFKIMLPEFEKLAKVKLKFFEKMERILDTFEAKKTLRKLFCEYVQLSGNDLCQYDEALAAFVKRQSELLLSFLSNKERKKITEQIKREYDDLDGDDINDILNGESAKLNEKFAEKEHSKSLKQESKGNDLNNLSINEIYKALAKKMHPDLEPDEAIKLEKGKFMQELTVAKNEKNLKALMGLQSRAIKEFGIYIDTVYGLEKLKAFNAMLQQSKSQLQNKLNYSFEGQFKKGKQSVLNIKEQITKIFKAEAKEVKQHTANTSAYTNQMYHLTDVQEVLDDYFESDEFLDDIFS